MKRNRPIDLGRLCPSCGIPLRQRDTDCPHCGLPVDLPEELRGGVLTPFGYGMCGLLCGAIWGLVAALLAPGYPERQALLLWPLMGGLGMAIMASAVGKRLVVNVRCAYEHLLLALGVGSLIAACAVVLGVQQLETLLPLAALVVAVIYGLLRRFGYRSGTGRR